MNIKQKMIEAVRDDLFGRGYDGPMDGAVDAVLSVAADPENWKDQDGSLLSQDLFFIKRVNHIKGLPS